MDNDYNIIILDKKQEIENMQLIMVQESQMQQGFNPGEIQSSIFKAIDISIALAKPVIKA